MPEVRERALALTGLADLSAMPSPDTWRDCDRARVLGEDADSATLAAWPGHRRVAQRLIDAARHGAAGNRIAIIGADEALVRKGAGHLLAAIDRAAGTDGRVLGIAHMTGGVAGSRMVGRPVKLAGAGTLDDLESGGVLAAPIDWLGGAAAGLYVIEITDADAGGDTFRWARDGSDATHGVHTLATEEAGSWIELENGVRVRFGAITGHAAGDRWLIVAGGRPMLLAELNRLTPHDYVSFAGAGGKVVLGNSWNKAMIDDGRAVREAGLPAPQIKPSTTTAGGSETDLAGTDVEPTDWTAGPNVTIRSKDASPDPARGSAYLSFDLNLDSRKKGQVLGWRNVSATIPATCKRLRMYLYTEGLKRGKIARKTFEFVAASGADLAGDQVTVTIPASVARNRWCHVDIPWSRTEAFTLASIGLRLKQTLPREFFVTAEADLSIYLDSLRMVADVEESDTLDETSEYRLCFTWLDQETGRESAPSPASEPMGINAAALSIDLSGYEPGMPAGLPNTPPAGATAVHVYIANPVWGTDPRLGLGLSYFRLTPDVGLGLEKLTGGAHGELIATFADELSKALLTAPDRARQPFFNSQPRPGDCLVGDGNLIVSALTHDHRIGEWTFTNGSFVITPVAGDDAPTPGAWMEGRSIRRDGDGEAYMILKALDQNGDGIPDALYIGTDFDADEQELATPYQGISGTGKSTILGDRKTIHWTNESEQFGVDPEASSLLNQLTVMDGADDIIGLGKAGEFLWVLGTRNAYVLRQTAGALADQPTSGVAYSNPLHLPGIGMAARRTWVARPDGSALFLGARGQLYVASGTSVQQHPVSERLAAILSGMGWLTDPGALRHAFAEHVANGRDEYLFLGLVSGSAERALPGVVAGARDTHELGELSTGGLAITHPDWEAISLPNATRFLPFDSREDHAASFLAGVTRETPGGVPEAEVWEDNNPGSDPFGDGAHCYELTASAFPMLEFDATGLDQRIHPDSTHLHLRIYVSSAIAATAAPTLIHQDGVSGGWNVAQCNGITVRSVDEEVDPETFEHRFFVWECPLTQNLAVGWNDVIVALPAAPTDCNPSDGGTYFKAFDPRDFANQALASVVLNVGYGGPLDPTVMVRVANGRQEIRSETTGTEIDPLAFGGCSVPGTAIVTAALDTDFDLGLLVDLRRNLVFSGRECRWTCPGLASASSCSSTAQLPAPNFLGDRDGYLSLAFDEATYAWGAPGTRFVYEVHPSDPGSGATLRILRDLGEAANALALARDPSGAGVLAGLVAAKLSPSGAIEWRRITASTIDTITVSEAWTAAPTAGDVLIVAPLPAVVSWGELRGRRPMCLRELALDLQSEQAWQDYAAGGLDPWALLEVLAADPAQTRATLAARVSKTFRGSDALRGLGRVRIPPHVSRTLAYRLTLLGPQTSPLQVRHLTVSERMQSGEGGR